MRKTENKRKLPWLNPGDRLMLAVVSAVLIVLLGVQYVLGMRLWKPAAQFEPGTIANHRLDINKASQWELEALRGIGPKRALDIVEFRKKKGAFKTVDDLTNVSGISAKTLERLRPYLTTGELERDNEREQR